MYKKSILYHRLWYLRKRRFKKLHILMRFVIIVIILVLLVSYADKKLMPCFKQISELKVKSAATIAINDIVTETFSDGITYNDLTIVSRDKSEKITSVEINVINLNRLSSTLTSQIQEKLVETGQDKISIPFGSLLGCSLFAGAGPDLYVKVKHVGNVEANFRSEFTSSGINQTKHRLYIQVRANIVLVGLLSTGKSEIDTEIPVMETIIVGDLPEIYVE